MFRSDVPITIVPMISSVTWDVTRGGMARAHDGLMMPLVVGRNHVPSLVVLCIVMLIMLNVMFLSVHCDVSFLFLPLLLIRWLDFSSYFPSFSFDLSGHALERGSGTPRCGGTLFRSFVGFLLLFLCSC